MKAFIAVAALAFCSVTAFAADDSSTAPAGGGKHWAACSDDLQKFCADIEKGKGKKRECLTQHTADLSAGCKASLDKHASKSGDAAPSAN